MSVDLHWKESEDGKQRFLFVGCNGGEVAWLYKRKKWWSASVYLPGLKVSPWAPLDEMTAEVEAAVRHWFGLANTYRPATDSGDDQ